LRRPCRGGEDHRVSLQLEMDRSFQIGRDRPRLHRQVRRLDQCLPPMVALKVVGSPVLHRRAQPLL
jgi:hypothetical protein